MGTESCKKILIIFHKIFVQFFFCVGDFVTSLKYIPGMICYQIFFASHLPFTATVLVVVAHSDTSARCKCRSLYEKVDVKFEARSL